MAALCLRHHSPLHPPKTAREGTSQQETWGRPVRSCAEGTWRVCTPRVCTPRPSPTPRRPAREPPRGAAFVVPVLALRTQGLRNLPSVARSQTSWHLQPEHPTRCFCAEAPAASPAPGLQEQTGCHQCAGGQSPGPLPRRGPFLATDPARSGKWAPSDTLLRVLLRGY